MLLGKHFGTSPKEIYEEWSLPMVIVTYVYIHNANVTDYGYQQEMYKSKHPPIVHFEKNYIRNITPDMLEEQQKIEETNYSPEQEALLAMYERTKK